MALMGRGGTPMGEPGGELVISHTLSLSLLSCRLVSFPSSRIVRGRRRGGVVRPFPPAMGRMLI
jgi:hypothetical protein